MGYSDKGNKVASALLEPNEITRKAMQELEMPKEQDMGCSCGESYPDYIESTVDAILECKDEAVIQDAGEAGLITLRLLQFQLWGLDRNITADGGATALSQMDKFFEEARELLEAIKAEDKDAVLDSVGDAIVVLVQILNLENLSLADALDKAWGDIKDRKGRMVDGVFVKEQ